MKKTSILSAFIINCSLYIAALQGEEYSFAHENVLGTRFELRVDTELFEQAQAVEQAALSEIDRLANIFSNYDAKSELSRVVALNPSETQVVSAELASLMQNALFWQTQTNNAFHVGAESIFARWKKAEVDGKCPTASELASLVAQLQSAPYTIDERNIVERKSSYSFSLNAIAEGYILDAAMKKAIDVAVNTPSLVMNLGGEVRVHGEPKQVAIKNAWHPADNAPAHTAIRMQNQALATSGGYHRGYEINSQYYSHVIDPRTGNPVEHHVTASVLADDATTADALATAFCVLEPTECILLSNSLDRVGCLIVDTHGKSWTNEFWESQVVTQEHMFAQSKADSDAVVVDGNDTKSAWNGNKELKIDFEINQENGGGRYRRPYIAVWIEDADGFPVKTIALWVQSTGPGPRWIPDLKRWYKSDRLRKLANDTDLVATVSQATHKPGKYDLVWNGQDDSGQVVAAGAYTLYIEAAREHGTYQLIKQPLELTNEESAFEPEGNVEIKSVKITYQDAESK